MTLIEKLEAASGPFQIDMEDQTSICAAFGVHQHRHPKAGWKRWYPETSRWGSPLRPASSLDDLAELLRQRGRLPEQMNTKPWIACAEALKARGCE